MDPDNTGITVSVSVFNTEHYGYTYYASKAEVIEFQAGSNLERYYEAHARGSLVNACIF